MIVKLHFFFLFINIIIENMTDENFFILFQLNQVEINFPSYNVKNAYAHKYGGVYELDWSWNIFNPI